LAGQLGRFALSLTGARFSLLSKFDESGSTRTGGRCADPARAPSMKGRTMDTGTVKFYNNQKGFGFIQPDHGDKDVFVHVTALERAGITGLREGQKVKYDTKSDPRNGKIAVGTLELA
jgi:CspA family cold shock protein